MMISLLLRRKYHIMRRSVLIVCSIGLVLLACDTFSLFSGVPPEHLESDETVFVMPSSRKLSEITSKVVAETSPVYHVEHTNHDRTVHEPGDGSWQVTIFPKPDMVATENWETDRQDLPESDTFKEFHVGEQELDQTSSHDDARQNKFSQNEETETLLEQGQTISSSLQDEFAFEEQELETQILDNDTGEHEEKPDQVEGDTLLEAIQEEPYANQPSSGYDPDRGQLEEVHEQEADDTNLAFIIEARRGPMGSEGGIDPLRDVTSPPALLDAANDVTPPSNTRLSSLSPDSTLDPNEKYITFFSTGGFANQLRASQRVAALALKLNRTLILPPLASVHVARKTWFRPFIDRKNDPMFRDLEVFPKEVADKAYSSQNWYALRPQEDFDRIGLKRPIYLSDHIPDAALAMKKCWNKQYFSMNKLPSAITKSMRNDRILCVGNGDRLPVQKLHFLQMYEPNQLVLDSAEQFIHEQQLGKFVAIHVRRGDFERYCGHMKSRVSSFNYRACWPSWKEIYARVEEVQKRYKVGKVFLTTNEEDPVRFKEFEEKGWVLLSGDFVTQFLQNSPGFRDDTKNPETHMALADIVLSQFIAARSHVFIGTYQSSFSGFIRYLRGKKNSLFWA